MFSEEPNRIYPYRGNSCFMKNTRNIFVTAILYIKHERLLGGTALGYCGMDLVGKLTPTKKATSTSVWYMK